MRIFFTDALGNPIFGFRRRQQQLLHGGGGGGCGTSLVVMAQPPSNSEELAAWYYTDAPVRTTLFYYIMNRNWEWVLRRCRTHPHEVFQFDGRTGDTPLHACCRLNPPPQVVRALMSVTAAAVAAASTATTTTTTTTPVLRRFSFTSSSPSKQAAAAAAMTTLSSNFNNNATAASHHNNGSTCCQELVYNKDGWTALHVAASNHCSRQVLEVLVEYAPEAVSQLTRKTKRAPIHCATASFRGLDRDAFFYLLNVSLTRLVKDDSDDNNNDDDSSSSSSENEYDIKDSDKINSSNGHKNTTKKLATGTNLLCLKDGTGQTPLALLFKKYRERVRHVCQQMDQLQLSRNDALELVQTELGTLWDKARSLVERLSAVLSSSESKAVTRHIKTASNKGSDQHHHHHHYDSDDDQSDIATTAAAMAAPMMAGALTASSASSSLHNRIQQPTTSQHNRRSSHRRLSSILKFRSRSSLQGRRFRLVHASVGLIRFGCPPEMIRLAVSLYPHQVSEVDEDGNLPLHIAAMAFHEQAVATAEAEEMASLLDDASSLHTNSSHNNINNNYHIGSTSNNSSNWDTMSVISETTAASTLAGFSSNKSLWDQIFDMLLQQYPDAARTPQQQPAMATKSSKRRGGGGGMIRSTPPPRPTYCSQDDTLPLVIAMRSCTHTMSWKRDGLERLMHAYAPALHLVLDGTTTVNTTQSATTKSLTISSSSTCTSWHCYPHLFALLLAKDHENDHLLMSSGRSCSFRRFANGRRTTPLRPRSIRMDPSLRRRTPLDIARISAVYRLLQTKPEMIANHCWSNGKNSRAPNHSPAVASAATKGAQPTKTTKTPTKKSHPK
ncbi:hypothetical protein ACA910_001636 [Epithemia clementina (nom. ined.)]